MFPVLMELQEAVEAVSVANEKVLYIFTIYFFWRSINAFSISPKNDKHDVGILLRYIWWRKWEIMNCSALQPPQLFYQLKDG